MSSAAWGCILLGVVTILTSVMGILLDCRSASKAGNGSKSLCRGFYSVLMFSGVLLAVVGALLLSRAVPRGITLR